MSALEALISVDPNGVTWIPIQNYQQVCVKLDQGTQLGAVKWCTLPDQVETELTAASGVMCAHVRVEDEDPERYHRLLEALALPESKLKAEELAELKSLLGEFTDVFAFDNSELGCTDIVRHTIDTGDSKPIKQQPYRTL